jgi:tetratricopeptide (TPR) repeat protein
MPHARRLRLLSGGLALALIVAPAGAAWAQKAGAPATAAKGVPSGDVRARLQALIAALGRAAAAERATEVERLAREVLALLATPEGAAFAPVEPMFQSILGSGLGAQGRHGEAAQAFERAHRVALQVAPGDRDAHFDHARNRTVQLARAGRPVEAEAAARIALTHAEGVRRADVLALLTEALFAQGRHGAARATATEAVEIRRAAKPADARLLATALADLGTLIAQTGDPALAVERLREAERALPPDAARDRAAVLANLANVESSMGETARAERSAREAVRLSVALNPRDPKVEAVAKSALAFVLTRRSDFVGGAQWLLEAQAALEGLPPGFADAERVQVANSLAAVRLGMGQPVPAETHVRETLRLVAANPGFDPAIAVRGHMVLAEALHQQNRRAESLDAQDRAAQIARGSLPPGSPLLPMALGQLARGLVAAGRPVEAEATAREAMALHRALPSSDGELLSTVLLSLADALGEQGRREEAAAVYDEGFALLAARHAGWSHDKAVMRSDRALNALLAGRPVDAYLDVREGGRELVEGPGAQAGLDPDARRTMERWRRLFRLQLRAGWAAAQALEGQTLEQGPR